MWMYFFFFAYVCVYVWGEWRAACPCLVWLSFTRPLGSRELDSLTAWTGRREREREGERRRRRRGGKKRGGGTLRARRAWLNTRARTHTRGLLTCPQGARLVYRLNNLINAQGSILDENVSLREGPVISFFSSFVYIFVSAQGLISTSYPIKQHQSHNLPAPPPLQQHICILSYLTQPCHMLLKEAWQLIEWQLMAAA